MALICASLSFPNLLGAAGLLVAALFDVLSDALDNFDGSSRRGGVRERRVRVGAGGGDLDLHICHINYMRWFTIVSRISR